MPRNKRHKKTNTSNIFLRTRQRMARWRTWKKIAIITGAIALVILGGYIIFAPHNNNGATKMRLTTNTPHAIEFIDNNTMTFVANGTTPDVNNRRNMSSIMPLVVSYELESGRYAGAFKMELTPTDLQNNIKITPFIRGTWKTRGPSSVIFTPDADWPADTKFTVKINRNILNPDVKMNTTRISFTTPQITATVDNFNLYPDTTRPRTMTGIAVISFNYPINTTNFTDKVSLKIDGDKLPFSVRFDKYNRTAFIISDPITVTDAPQILRLKINRVPDATNNSSTQKITAHTTIESADNIFKIADITTTAADDARGNVHQLILLNTTTAASQNTNWGKYVTAYLLPKYKSPQTDGASHAWANDEITDDVISRSKKLNIELMDFATPAGIHQYAFSYDVSDNDARYIYVSVDGGMESSAGFKLHNGSNRVMRVAIPPRTVKIAGTGALLTLGGDKKLGLMARGGVESAHINLYKIKSSEINHLISQTYNIFAQNIEFKSWSFDAYDMASVFEKRIPFADHRVTKTNYASIDLGEYLDRTGADKTGIFIVQAGFNGPAANRADRRLILLTNLGIIRKQNLDESSMVFVSNLTDGTPAIDVEISVLGRNGNPIWAGRTDSGGVAQIPVLARNEYIDARAPVAIVARRGDDVSFIPYMDGNIQSDYSKFETDGEYASAATPLNAFLFSDRGIYRPGEEITIGGIVKNRTFKSLAGIPVRIEITDARGRTTLEKSFSLSPDGMFDIKYNLSDNAPLGEYTVNMYSLTQKNKIHNTLGRTTLRVEEFTPDAMKISATIPGANDTGWISPENITTDISLQNLFGTPASDRRISATATLRPVTYSFDAYPEYIFTPNFITNTDFAAGAAHSAQTYTTEIDDIYTDDSGTAKMAVKFASEIPSGTYLMTLNIRGFERGSGKNVQTNISTRVSDAKYILGYHTNADLSYVNRGASPRVTVIAVDHTGAPTNAPDLTMRLVLRENLTSLVKDYTDTYKYQTVTRDRVISEKTIDITTAGLDMVLSTENGGTYYAQILDASGKILANIEYFVASNENLDLQSDTSAELKIKLDKSEYNPGDQIDISITAPYTGTGLITIERDRVYAYKWFNATTTTSIQSIAVPAGFEGTGYVNVSFVRDINSRDIFTTPYAYAVAPFTADVSRRTIDIELTAPKTVTDNKITVKYTPRTDARMMIFGVNTGILQVAKYQLPNPIAHFFKKSALQVDTFQILSLLLPEYKILREYAQTGGGDYAGVADGNGILTNPFARKNAPSVAFYSGIINATGNKTGEITFDIPESFNGEITIFAVAANTSAIGAADTRTNVQSPVIISATTPLMAAPGDEFDINTVISNLTPDSGDATTNVEISTSANLTIDGTNTARATIAHGADGFFTFAMRANDTPGAAEITTRATIAQGTNKLAERRTTNTMSVRPITPFTTDITAGTIENTTTQIRKFHIDMYPEFAMRKLYIAKTADAYIRPLFEYLKQYEYPCSEQLASRALPYVLMPRNEFLGTKYETSVKFINDTVNTLKNRQNDDGSFDLWAGGETTSRDNITNANTAYVTAYVTMFLSLARDNGFNVPNDMHSRALGYLRTYAGQNITSDQDAAATAFAIYVISANDFVTTSYINLFQEYADKNIRNWKTRLMGAYIAASYKILHQDSLAHDIMSQYKPSTQDRFIYKSEFDNNIANDGMYYYLGAKYFDTPAPISSGPITAYINSGNYSSFTSAMVILGLGGGATPGATPLNINLGATDSEIEVRASNAPIIATIADDVKSIKIKCADCHDNNGMYFTLMQSGFPRNVRAHARGLEIVREYYDDAGNRITSGAIGDIATVKISVRTRGGTDVVPNAVITDLLPAGFIPDPESMTGDATFYEFREDRVLIFADITRTPQTFTYHATMGTAGRFTAPPISVMAMTNPQISATTAPTKFIVTNATQQ